MRIGIVTTWFERGAAYVSRQYRSVLAKSHDVFIFARGGEQQPRDSPEWHDANVTWGRQPYSAAHNALDLQQFRRWITSRRLDVVFFNEQTWWPPVLLARDLGVTAGTYVDYYTERTVPLFAAFDFLICNTRRHHGVFAWHPQAYYVPWGTDVEVFVPSSYALTRPDRVTFFHSCGISPKRKGTDLVIRAFASVSHLADLVIHTQIPLRSSLPDLSSTIDRLEGSKALRIHERTVGPPGLFGMGDVYVYPTRLEGIGLTIMEAMACGLPVVAPDAGPMNEFVTPDVGRLVPVSRFVARHDGYYWPQNLVDADAVRDAMLELASDPGRIPAMKRRTREHAEASLDWRRNAAELEHLFPAARRLPEAGSAAVRQTIEQFEADRKDRHAVSLRDRVWLFSRRRHPAVGRTLDRLRRRPRRSSSGG